jgi:hypothetical protein
MYQPDVQRRATSRLPAVIASVALVVGFNSDGIAGASTSEPPGSTVPAAGSADVTTRTLNYVAFGDSWPEGAHCNGCTPFPRLWAEDLDAHPGWDIEFTDYTGSHERSPDQSKGTASLLATLENDEETRAAVQTADIILIATGTNELDNGEEVWHDNFDAILTEIETLRDGKPTAIRLVNAANPPFLPPEIFELLTIANCDAAEAHDAICIDVRPLILGPAFDQPGDENSPETMRAITDALLATGLPELN